MDAAMCRRSSWNTHTHTQNWHDISSRNSFKFEKIWQTTEKQKQPPSKQKHYKSIRSNSAGGCIHITSGLVSSKTFRASRAKTPLTPDKGRKWIPTCGEEELKRPSLIMTNMRWWLHCAFTHACTHTHTIEWMRDNHQLNIHKWKQLATTHIKDEQKTPNNAKIGFSIVQIMNASKPNSTLTTYPVSPTSLHWNLRCHWFSSKLSLSFVFSNFSLSLH